MNTRKIIITLCFFAALMLQRMTNVEAVPDLQLFIPGATYSGVGDPDPKTWIFSHTPGSPFTLRVISANENHPRPDSTGVFVSMALMGFGEHGALPAGNILNFAGTNYTAANFTWGKPDDLPTHKIFDAHYVQINVGSFNTSETVYDMKPGKGGSASGQAKDFSVTIYGSNSVHFDAYTLEWEEGDEHHPGEWEIDEKAPFSHDAASTPVPEPATIALLSIGIISLLGYKGRNFLRKS